MNRHTEKSSVKLFRAKHSGFCFGVKRAIQISLSAAEKHKNIYIKGDIVHNDAVCRKIEKAGIKRVGSLDKMPDYSTFIIKAHGEGKKTYDIAKTKKLKIIDATCPYVHDIHKKAKHLEKNNYQVIIIGDARHEETKGIQGSIKNGIIIDSVIKAQRIKNQLKNKIGIVCQSTQSIKKVAAVIAKLSEYTDEMVFLNTICRPTRLRQKEVNKLASKHKAVLIIGSKKSANTKRLYQIAKEINRNSFWIASPKNFSKNKLSKFKSIGVIGGASTPPETLKEIENCLK